MDRRSGPVVLRRSDEAEDQGQRRNAVCDGKPRQLYPGDLRLAGFRSRQPFGVGGRKVNHQADHGARLMRKPHDAGATHLEQAGKFLGRARQQWSSYGFKMDAVVGDEPRERQRPRTPSLNEIEHEPRFAGA